MRSFGPTQLMSDWAVFLDRDSAMRLSFCWILGIPEQLKSWKYWPDPMLRMKLLRFLSFVLMSGWYFESGWQYGQFCLR